MYIDGVNLHQVHSKCQFAQITNSIPSSSSSSQVQRIFFFWLKMIFNVTQEIFFYKWIKISWISFIMIVTSRKFSFFFPWPPLHTDTHATSGHYRTSSRECFFFMCPPNLNLHLRCIPKETIFSPLQSFHRLIIYLLSSIYIFGWQYLITMHSQKYIQSLFPLDIESSSSRDSPLAFLNFSDLKLDWNVACVCGCVLS